MTKGEIWIPDSAKGGQVQEKGFLRQVGMTRSTTLRAGSRTDDGAGQAEEQRSKGRVLRYTVLSMQYCDRGWIPDRSLCFEATGFPSARE